MGKKLILLRNKLNSIFKKRSDLIGQKTSVDVDQSKLDHDQHYDLDGVSQQNGHIIVLGQKETDIRI